MIFTLTAPMLFELLGRKAAKRPNDEQLLLAAIHFYDLRGGGIETQNKSDKQGLGLLAATSIVLRPRKCWACWHNWHITW